MANARSGFSGALTKNAKVWNQAKKAEARGSFGFTDVPDGKYIAQIISMIAGLTKKGNAQVNYLFEIAVGDYAGKTGRKNADTDPPTGKTTITVDQKFEWLVQDLKTLSIVVDDPSKIEEQCKAMTDDKPFVELNLSTNASGNQGVYINKLVSPDEVPDGALDHESNDDSGSEEVTGNEDDNSAIDGTLIPEVGAQHSVVSERDGDDTPIAWHEDGEFLLIITITDPDVGDGNCEATSEDGNTHVVAWSDLDAPE